MSGVNRNIKAEIVSDGKVSIKELQAKFSPKAILAETGRGRTANKGTDGEYRGKNAMNAKKK